MSIAIVPGSFDPITLGHLYLIRRAAELYDEVVVAVMINDQKSYRFSLSERAEMAALATKELSRVRVVQDSGLLVDLFDRLGATAIVKGVRNDADRRYEEEMAAYNLEKNPRAVTVLLDTSEELREVSSTRVRAALDGGAGAEELLPCAVLSYLQAKRR